MDYQIEKQYLWHAKTTMTMRGIDRAIQIARKFFLVTCDKMTHGSS